MTYALRAGADAEEIAADFLAAKGMHIVARNFRTRFGEIDLVARDGESLVFVEVRMRKNDYFGVAADSVDVPKRARVVAAARAYLALVHPEPPCRFDVVTLDGDSPRWIRAAFDVVG
jgi:putative endonuclease